MAYTGSSIVDYLGSTGQASDYASRAKLATSKGITGYAGTADQNTQLLNMLRAGSNPSATTPQQSYVNNQASFFQNPPIGFQTNTANSTPQTLGFTPGSSLMQMPAVSTGVQHGPFLPTAPQGVSTGVQHGPSLPTASTGTPAPYKPTTPKDAFVNNQATPSAPAGTGTPPPAGAGTPAASGPSAADTAFAEYLKSLMPSAEETAAEAELNRLNTDANLANERALNSGETMGFAGGEAQRVNRNNDIRIAGQSGRLQQIQGERANMTAAQKARYEYELGKEKAAASANPAFELSPGQERWTYNEKTGEYEKTASVAKDPLDAAYKQAQIDNLHADNARQASGGNMTAGERKDDAYAQINSALTQGARFGKTAANPYGIPYLDAEGYMTREGFSNLLKFAMENGVSRKDFIANNIEYIGKGDKTNPYSNYNLTAAEKKQLLTPTELILAGLN